MKQLFLLQFFLLTGWSASAQDTIVQADGRELIVTISEVGISTVTYKRFDNPQGPLYSIMKRDVKMIRFANGTVEVMPPPAQMTGHEITVRGPFLYRNGKHLYGRAFINTIRSSGNANAIAALDASFAANKRKRVNILAGCFGIPVGLGAVAGGVVGIVESSRTGNYRRWAPYAVLGAAGVAGVACSIVLLTKARSHYREAKRLQLESIRLFNEGR